MKGSPRQYVLAALCAFGSGIALGWMPHALIWLAMIYGYVVAEATLRGGGRKRGLAMQMIAGVAAAVGYTVWALPHGYVEFLALLTSPWSIAAFVIGIFFAVTHVRYI